MSNIYNKSKYFIKKNTRSNDNAKKKARKKVS